MGCTTNQSFEREFLQNVQTPARYLGSEHNSVQNDPRSVAVHFALCYPDMYEIGMSHLGSQILYAVINSHPQAYCERVYHPAHDAVAVLREHGLPLCSLETRTPLSEFDFVGVTLQHELNYTSVLSLLDLGGVALRSAGRAPGAPLVIGGGPCAYNPEPLAPFFDLFVIGEGEEVVREILDVYAAATPAGGRTARSAAERERLLAALGELEGVYVPALGTGKVVHKRLVQSLQTTPVVETPVVPHCQIVHDRGQLEINRGCTRGCRFCQAGMIYRPVRERTTATLTEQAVKIIDNTGYDEISLVSLNCPDYSDILTLVDRLHEQLGPRRVALGLPSLRTDSFSVELAERVQRVKKTGLTFAPEAGSQGLRDAINKNVTEQDLLQAAGAAFAAGWQRLKLYFMIGLPGETEEDLRAIADLVHKVLALGREKLGKGAGRLTISVSVASFIPKPHTPLQWARQDTIEELESKQALLRGLLGRHRQVKASFHSAQQAILEGLLARGGRDWADLIEDAYRAGACFESWHDNFSLGVWLQAGQARGRDLPAEAQREWALEAPLPWDHISCGVSKEFLRRELQQAECRGATADCRWGECSNCGVHELAEACGTLGGRVAGEAQ